MPIRQFLTAALASTAISACASTPAVTSGSQAESNQTLATLAAGRPWSGRFNPTQSVSGALMPSVRQNGSGSVDLTPSTKAPELTHVRLVTSVSLEPGMDALGWAIEPGNCGSGSTPVIPASMFPPLQVNANGQARMDVDLPVQLTASGTYHVDVFRGTGSQPTDVITCAELHRKG